VGRRIDDQHAKAEIFAAAVEFVGDVPTKHAGPDDDDIKRITAVVADLMVNS
jgi:hypothetical protein